MTFLWTEKYKGFILMFFYKTLVRLIYFDFDFLFVFYEICDIYFHRGQYTRLYIVKLI